MPALEVVIDEGCCSRQHAEIFTADGCWLVRDLGSSNGTFLNSTRVGRTGHRVRQGDVLLIGRIPLHVVTLAEGVSEPTLRDKMRVETTAEGFWNQVGDATPSGASEAEKHIQAFLRLLRDVMRLSHSTLFEPGLRAVLDDVIKVFDAQRGGIFLFDPAVGGLKVKSVAVARRPMAPRATLSRTLAQRAFDSGQSVLYRNSSAEGDEFDAASVRLGDMTSVICAVMLFADTPCGILHLDRGPLQEPFTESDLQLADSLAAALALGIDRWQLAEKQQDALLQTVTALAQAVELRDPYTGNHTHRVTQYSLIIADELSLSSADRKLLQLATPLHDIGKIAVEDSVLRKSEPLTPAEWEVMKGHVINGVNIIQMLPGLAWTLPVIRSHHERWDGTGYPDGLKGSQIPLAARVVAVADAFDAMTTDRPYRKGMSIDAAFAELQAKISVHFDPTCVNAFVRARAKVEKGMRQEAQLQSEAADFTKTLSEREGRQLLAQTLDANVMRQMQAMMR